MKHGAGQKQDFAKFTTSMQSLKIAKTQETNDPPPKKTSSQNYENKIFVAVTVVYVALN